MPAKVLVLGAGFGGLELTSRLSSELGDDVDVTLIDQSDSFVFGFAKLDVLFGLRSPQDVRSYYRDIAKPGVTFRQETITAIDPTTRQVRTNRGEYDADVLVVALGADLDPAATPGIDQGFGHEFYSVAGAEKARKVVAEFDGGDVVIGILGPSFKCPPAPFETAFMLDQVLRERGRRERSTIRVVSPLPAPIPVSKDASAGVRAGCEQHGVEFVKETMVTSLDGRTATAHNGATFDYDLFLAIPRHCAPQVVVDGGLTEEDGWIAVDAGTLETKFPGVYAVGDVTSMPVPRAGVFAEGEAAVVAQRIIAYVRGESTDARYGGTASCYLEWGDGTAARVDLDFFGGPAPTGRFQEPSAAIHAEKDEFGADRRRRWFG